jgi:SAM-dependent methyltransferase
MSDFHRASRKLKTLMAQGLTSLEATDALKSEFPSLDQWEIGDLYSRGLDLLPAEDGKVTLRKKLGAHYTPIAAVRRLVELTAPNVPERRHTFRVLDPACGDGRVLAFARQAFPKGIYAGCELDEGALELARRNLGKEAKLFRLNPLDNVWSWFDVIIGNPPFIPYYARYSQGAKPSLPGRRNAFADFCEWSIAQLERGGILAFVVPDTLLINRSFQPLRDKFVTNGEILHLEPCQDISFSDARVGWQLLVWRKIKSDIPNFQVGSRWVDLPMPDFGEPTLELGEFAKIKDGINPGPAEVRRRIIRMEPQPPPWMPAIAGGDIAPSHLFPPSHWVLYDPEQLSLFDRKRGASLRNPAIFREQRIVYRQTADRPIAAICPAGIATLNSVHNILIPGASREALETLCDYLNSDRCAMAYRAMTGETRNIFPQVHIADMKRLPVPVSVVEAMGVLR